MFPSSIEESFAEEIVSVTSKECMEGEQKSFSDISSVIQEKKLLLESLISSQQPTTNNSYLQNSPYYARATGVFTEFKRLSPAILAMTESAVELGSNLNKMHERLHLTGKQINGMKRKADQIVYDKLNADIVAITDEYTVSANALESLLSELENCEDKRDKVKEIVDGIEAEIIRMGESAGLSISSAGDIDIEKVDSSSGKIKLEMDRIARGKESLENNLRMKREDIEKLLKGNGERAMAIEDLKESTKQYEEELVRLQEENRELGINVDRDRQIVEQMRTNLDDDSARKAKLGERLKEMLKTKAELSSKVKVKQTSKTPKKRTPKREGPSDREPVKRKRVTRSDLRK